MLIACKCLNLVVNTNSINNTIIDQQQQQEQHLSTEHDKNEYEKSKDETITKLYGVNIDELQKFQKSHRIYGKCLKFFRQVIEFFINYKIF